MSSHVLIASLISPCSKSRWSYHGSSSSVTNSSILPARSIDARCAGPLIRRWFARKWGSGDQKRRSLLKMRDKPPGKKEGKKTATAHLLPQPSSAHPGNTSSTVRICGHTGGRGGIRAFMGRSCSPQMIFVFGSWASDSHTVLLLASKWPNADAAFRCCRKCGKETNSCSNDPAKDSGWVIESDFKVLVVLWSVQGKPPIQFLFYRRLHSLPSQVNEAPFFLTSQKCFSSRS